MSRSKITGHEEPAQIQAEVAFANRDIQHRHDVASATWRQAAAQV